MDGARRRHERRHGRGRGEEEVWGGRGESITSDEKGEGMAREGECLVHDDAFLAPSIRSSCVRPRRNKARARAPTGWCGGVKNFFMDLPCGN